MPYVVPPPKSGIVWLTNTKILTGPGIEAKFARCAETGETIILCRSADRKNKERAMHEKFSARIEAALARLAGRIEHATRRIDPTQVNRQIGRILQQNQRAAARFDGKRPAIAP